MLVLDTDVLIDVQRGHAAEAELDAAFDFYHARGLCLVKPPNTIPTWDFPTRNTLRSIPAN